MKMRVLRFGRCLAMTAAMSAAQPTWAFDAQYYIDLSSSMLMTMQYGRVIEMQAQYWREPGEQADKTPASAPATHGTRFRGGTPAFPAKLAEHYPPAARADAQRLFEQLLSGFSGLEQQFGLERKDVANAVAAFIACSWMAYHNQDFPDEYFVPLVDQVRQALGSSPEFAAASDAEKQELYEQMAIMGMFLATTQLALQENPNAQTERSMRQAAEGYLENFLKTDAERVQITGNGLLISKAPQ